MADYDEDLTQVDESIRRLKVEFDIFFNGNRKKPPEDLRARVERSLKRLSEATDMSAAHRFRYNTLIARFYVYRDRWRRAQQQIESASGKVCKPEPAPPSPGPAARKPADAGSFEISIHDPDAENEKIRSLYEVLLRLRGADSRQTRPIPYQQFSEYVAAQAKSLQAKQGCSSVRFRVALEDNTIKFTVKADGASGG